MLITFMVCFRMCQKLLEADVRHCHRLINQLQKIHPGKLFRYFCVAQMVKSKLFTYADIEETIHNWLSTLSPQGNRVYYTVRSQCLLCFSFLLNQINLSCVDVGATTSY